MRGRNFTQAHSDIIGFVPKWLEKNFSREEWNIWVSQLFADIWRMPGKGSGKNGGIAIEVRGKGDQSFFRRPCLDRRVVGCDSWNPKSIFRTNIIRTAHREVLSDLSCSSSDRIDRILDLATDASGQSSVDFQLVSWSILCSYLNCRWMLLWKKRGFIYPTLTDRFWWSSLIYGCTQRMSRSCWRIHKNLKRERLEEFQEILSWKICGGIPLIRFWKLPTKIP
jgi:hypothetical protein